MEIIQSDGAQGGPLEGTMGQSSEMMDTPAGQANRANMTDDGAEQSCSNPPARIQGISRAGGQPNVLMNRRRCRAKLRNIETQLERYAAYQREYHPGE